MIVYVCAVKYGHFRYLIPTMNVEHVLKGAIEGIKLGPGKPGIFSCSNSRHNSSACPLKVEPYSTLAAFRKGPALLYNREVIISFGPRH